MTGIQRTYAEAGLAAAVKSWADFEFADAEGSCHRLTWAADWEAGTVTFDLLPRDRNDYGFVPAARWAVPLDCPGLGGGGAGPDSILGAFHAAYPRAEDRATYLFPGMPDGVSR